ncbi:MAG: T9SS type A sorting domain-containing protein [Bacteroidota bacterium]|nr:T9SS type A sorting domain-containing protein [Bacteroidota bacterium]
MNKKTIYTIFMVSISFVMNAQQDITFNTISFQGLTQGKMKYYYSTNNVNPNPITAGNGVTWDFTTLTAAAGDTLIRANGGSTSAYQFDFPSSNYIVNENNPKTSSVKVLHYQQKINMFLYDGYVDVTFGAEKYISSQQLLKFPFKFNEKFTDRYAASDGIYINAVVQYDGFGTLKLPSGTFSNVFRTVSKDSISPTKVFFTYKWFNSTYELLTIKKETSSTYVQYYHKPGAPTTSLDNIDNKVITTIYPNPSNGEINIETNFILGNAELEVFNQIGRNIIKQNLTEKNTIIKLEEPGIYLVKIKHQNNVYCNKVIIN